jgi:Methylamine utilization protein MauJ
VRVVEISVTSPFREHPIVHAPFGMMTQDFRAFAILYREAVASSGTPYEYLCLFKIAEGIRWRRSRNAEAAKKSGEQPTRYREVIPESESDFLSWLEAIYLPPTGWDEMALGDIFQAEALGRKVYDLLDHELTDLRDNIAHALSDKSGEIKHMADEALHGDRVRTWLPLTKSIVRLMLKNEFPKEFLNQLTRSEAFIRHHREDP